MDGINQPPQSQPSPSNHQPQSQKVAENQAQDFAKRLDKKKGAKDKKSDELDGKKGELSLESLLAERSKTVKGKQQHSERDHGRSSQEHELTGEASSREQTAVHGREMQLQSPSEVRLKGVEQISGPREINETISKLVDKIYVSAKDSVNGAEVRISMKDAVLPGTEIRIQRAGGEITVTMNTTSVESHNFLAQHEASLMKSLNDRFGNERVQVNLNMAGGEQNDGRSREEYVAEEEQEDNDDS